MDLATNVYRIETLHQFDLEDANELIKILRHELKFLQGSRPSGFYQKSEEQISARINWLVNMISFLESSLQSRISVVTQLEEKCRMAPELLNDAEMRVFLATKSLKAVKTTREIALEVGYDEGYVRNLISSIKRKTGIKVVTNM
ncbi:MAG: hypothetical protein A2Y16_05445 [Tenericutes bacterium GWF2_57_13]|nr:MAG: hypothetical protein A2Y16_05445 [Tenericutes bacterium GWF2_57_13]